MMESRSHESITVVIPAYNGAAWVGDAVESVLRQTSPAMEIIVVDDHSTDATLQVLDAYRDRCILLRTTSHAGHPAPGRNIGWRAATSTWIAFLDQDDLWLPDKLERQMAAAQSAPQVRMWHTNAVIPVGPGEEATRQLEDSMPLLQGVITPINFRNFIFRMSTVILRRDLLEEIGGLEERYWAVDDLALLLALARRREMVGVISKPLAWLRVHSARTSLRLTEQLPAAHGLLLEFARSLDEDAAPALALACEVARQAARVWLDRGDRLQALEWYRKAGKSAHWPLPDRIACGAAHIPLPGLWTAARTIGRPIAAAAPPFRPQGTMTIRQIPFSLAHAVLHSFGAPALPAVFIMGHMRCGSTLLLHILLTNPEMIGCGERNTFYRSPADIERLEIAARIAQRAPFRRVRYAVDQINHDRFTPNLDLLQDERVRCIFLIREPRATIQSILNLTQTFYKPWTAEQAVDYYSHRLQTLMDYAGRLDRHQMMAMTYDDLVTVTPSALRRVQSFLGLDEELHEHYKIQRFTGKRGDPSENILAGRIVRERVSRPIEIPDGELERARHAYEATARAFQL